MHETAPSLRSPTKLDSKQRARIDIRVLFEQKVRYEQAAALEGQTLSEFLIRGADEQTSRILDRHEAMVLRDEARSRFVDLILTPPEPTEMLRAAFERHDNEVESR